MRSPRRLPAELMDADRGAPIAPPPEIKAPTPKLDIEAQLERFRELGSWRRSQRGNLWNTLGKWNVTLCRGPRAVKVIVSNRQSMDGETRSFFLDGTLSDREVVHEVASRFTI